jgi:hypothetical protein
MDKRSFKKIIFTASILVLLVPWMVHAQETTPQGILYNLKTSTFPVIQFSMDPRDIDGNFITNLQPGDVTILEDDQKLQANDVKTYDPGLEFVVGINPNFSFAIMDTQARSRLDKIKDALTGWSSDLTQSSNHAYSLVTPDGPTAFHVKDLNSWLTGLAGWQPPMNTMEPTLDFLAQSIDLASTSLLEPGARRAVLFITPLAEKDDVPILESLTEQAKQLDVHVFVWVVAPPETGPTAGLIAQQALADQTGGRLVLFSGDEPLPGAVETLAALQISYRVIYNSGLRTSGEHTLSVQVKTEGEPISLTAPSFTLDVEAPNPILVSPPSQILRQYPKGGEFDPESLTPRSQEIEMIVEFPDGHPRPVVSTSLLVDGKVTATNTSEPYYVFNLDLTPYTSDSQHELQVKVVDSLGLEKTSISIPISITVEKTPSIMEIYYQRYKQWIILTVGLAAAIVLAWRLTRLVRLLKKKRENRVRNAGPIPLEDDFPPSRRKEKEVPASLEPFPQGGSSPGQTRIPLSAKEVRIGSDPKQVHFVLEDATVGELHALIRRNGETFFVIDMGSASGTWLNYEQISEEPRRLYHGDILHFGSLAYRFQLSNPKEEQEPRIVRLDSRS